MKLTYYGDFAFACVTKKGTIALNPEKKDAELLCSVFTKPDREIELEGHFLSCPGEFEYGGVALQLFTLPGDVLGAKVFTETIRLLFLPALPRQLSEEEMEIFGNVDVLILEVPEMKNELKKMTEEIDPRAVVPVGAGQEKFLAEMGSGEVKATDKFDFTVSSLPNEETMFVKLMAE